MRIQVVLPVLLVVVESGAIYTMGMLSTIIAHAADSNSMFAVLDFMPSLIVRSRHSSKARRLVEQYNCILMFALATVVSHLTPLKFDTQRH